MADSRLYLGEIYTVDDRLPEAGAAATVGGDIVAVGTERECRSALTGAFDVVDLEGGALLPGFIDSHMHPVMLIYIDMNINLAGSESIAAVQARIRSAARNAPPHTWLAALQLDDQALSEKRLPTRQELDAASLDHPLVIMRYDGHMAIANTAAIEASHVSASTPDPAGGAIDREPGGFPNGVFRENASRMVMSGLPIPDPNEFIAGAEATFARLASMGITTVGAVLQGDERGPAGPRGAFEIMTMEFLSQRLPQNLYSMVLCDDPEKIRQAVESPLSRPEGDGPGRKVGAMKIIGDGSYGSYTACMEQPYSDRPGTRGLMTIEPEALYERMVAGHNMGLQLAIHCIGDAANREVVALYRRLLEKYPREHRHRIEHASQLDADTIESMAELGIIVATQPLFIHSEKKWLPTRLGERTKMTYPFRSLLDAGVVVAGASDAPVESADVLQAIECCVTREGFEPSQCISAGEAVRMYTVDAAYAMWDEESRGSITPGKKADLVRLSASPASVAAEKISGITVEETVVAGKTVFKRD